MGRSGPPTSGIQHYLGHLPVWANREARVLSIVTYKQPGSSIVTWSIEQTLRFTILDHVTSRLAIFFGPTSRISSAYEGFLLCHQKRFGQVRSSQVSREESHSESAQHTGTQGCSIGNSIDSADRTIATGKNRGVPYKGRRERRLKTRSIPDLANPLVRV